MNVLYPDILTQFPLFDVLKQTKHSSYGWETTRVVSCSAVAAAPCDVPMLRAGVMHLLERILEVDDNHSPLSTRLTLADTML